MEIAVLGGTDDLGGHVTAELLRRGHTVRIVSRSDPASQRNNVTYRRADVRTAEGLDTALDGTSTVINAVNARSHFDEVMVAGTERILDAEARVGVSHHVEISIVGCGPGALRVLQGQDAAGAGTSRRPGRLEPAARDPVPLADHGHPGDGARYRVLPTGTARLQPIDPRIVAARLVDIAVGRAAGRVPDIGGPEVKP